MRSHNLFSGAVASIALLAVGCGDDGGGTGGASSGNGAGAGSTGALPSSGAGDLDPGDPHTPASGCDEGFVACGDLCVHVEDDGRHCGGCDLPCSQATTCDGFVESCGCLAGACVADAGCDGGPTCDGVCVSYGTRTNVDNCGSCGNRCGDLELCVENACLAQQGDGSSCESPLLWSDGEETAGFRMSPATTVPHTFRCGPLDAIPTRWFRVTTEQDDLRLELNGGSTDDYVLEVFDDDACGEADHAGCADGEVGGEVELEIEGVPPGTTYWVAVGLAGEWSGEPARLRIDQ